MEQVKYYRVGVELLDKEQRPTEHEYCETELYINDALLHYDNLKIETGKNAKYLIAVSNSNEEMILLSKGYKGDK